jgi:hypothetical protein
MAGAAKKPRDDDIHFEVCPECQGEVGCNGDGTWKCITNRGHRVGCGWRGDEPHCACQYGLTREQVEG